MKYLYKKQKGFRMVDGERQPFAFFVVGALVLLAVAFVLGLQVGRVIEKKAAQRKSETEKIAGPIEIQRETESEIRKDLGVFSEEAGKVPSVNPPSANVQLSETEKTLTFRETLAKKEPEPILLVSPPTGEKSSGPARTTRASSGGKLMVQAAAFRDRNAAVAFEKKLEKDGYKASVVYGTGGKAGEYHKVFVGPYPDTDSANRAIRKLKSEWKINAFPVRR